MLEILIGSFDNYLSIARRGSSSSSLPVTIARTVNKTIDEPIINPAHWTVMVASVALCTPTFNNSTRPNPPKDGIIA